jgi:hypothetical protein
VQGLIKDQWNMFYEFSKTINSDLANYDETQSCKLVIG